MDERTQTNVSVLDAELDWLGEVLDARLRRYFAHDAKPRARADPAPEPMEIAPPVIAESEADYARVVTELDLGAPERLALALALAPDLRPQLLDAFAIKNTATGRRFREFGGAALGSDDAFYPSGETLAFVLDEASLIARVFVAELLGPDHPFARMELLRAERGGGGGNTALPTMKAPLRVPDDTLALLTRGRLPRPVLGVDFPAQRIETKLDWDDLVLHPATRRQVEEIQTWLEHGETLLRDWGMAAKLRPGHRSLFHGPPGTGKSMTARLLGASTGRDVYRIDLSMVVSKYIGETEKNLAKVFDRAQQRGWILFFDEADALFGKRGETRESHDRYANQEVAYLLQRIESFDGVAILASNLPENLDDAFTRRFESVVYFPMPRADERRQLWQRGFPDKAELDGVDLALVAREHELSGGAIMNVVRHLCLESIAAGGQPIDDAAVRRAIRRELNKEGRGL